MRATRRGGGGQPDPHHRYVKINTSPNSKPLQSEEHEEQRQQQEEEGSNLDDFNTLTSTSQTQKTSDHTKKDPNSNRNKWNFTRNRRGNASKKRFIEKSDHGSSKCDSSLLNGEDNSLNIAGGSLITEAGSSSSVGEVERRKEDEGKKSTVSCTVKSGLENEGDETEKEEDDILTRLEKLQLGVDDLELTKDQQRLNDQLQEDELLAMEAIYGENVVMLDRHKGLRYFQIYINFELSSDLIITANLNLSNDHNTKSKSANDFLYSFKVQHLPPMVLTCLLPKSYPSHLPPYFTISVQWLNSIKISSLCFKLDSIWMEQPGQEVTYQWADWLQNYSLAHLGYDNELVLGPYGVPYAEDKRAVSGIVSPDVDVPSIRSYNDEKLNESFLKSFHLCCICFSEFPGTDFVKLSCQHFFCWNCLKTYSDIHVKEGTVSKLQCPDTKCEERVPPNLLKRLLGDEDYERWESLMLQKTLDSMSDIAYCPRCETPCIEDEDQHAQCSKCFFSFCTLCREKRHLGIACMTPELKLSILKERQKSSQLNEQQRHREREMINEILSVKEILRDAKQCPSCKMAISKTEGCNKMVCKNCGSYFCYRCNKAIDGYDHFRDGQCELFPQDEVQQWEARMNPRQAVGRVQAELFAGHGQTCPSCGQYNPKIGNNNHIFCWSCQGHYCYLCKKVVRRCSQHYGPKGCKQHTEG